MEWTNEKDVAQRLLRILKAKKVQGCHNLKNLNEKLGWLCGKPQNYLSNDIIYILKFI